MKNEPSDNITDAWINLLHAQQSCLETVEQAFKSNGFPPLSWYDVLWELERGEADGMRPYELGERILMPQYGLSRLLTRLEKAGYLKRRRSEEDGRGQVMVITRQGLALRKSMWPVYADALNRALTARISETEAKRLSNLLRKLV